MQVRGKKIAPPKSNGAQIVPFQAQSVSIPAPVRGWVLNENLAAPSPAGARVLDNWFCTQTGIRVRGGCTLFATVAAAVTSLAAYRSGSGKLFATTASAIYDITTPVSPTTVPSAVLSGRTSGDYSSVNYSTAGGNFMVLVNGADNLALFNGTTWTNITAASSPAITGVLTTKLSHVWTYANRLWFVEKGTQTAWYLPVDSIGGAAVSFSLAGTFRRGGTLLFGASWSLSSGDGLGQKCVFVSTNGEVAVYQGTNPASAADWAIVGRFDMPRPLGKNGQIQAGGDLLIATVGGLIPLSAAIDTDIAAMEQKSVAANIAPYWQAQATGIEGSWQMAKGRRSGVMYVTQPSAYAKTGLAVNLITGAWSRVTGWDMRCAVEYGDEVYFGSADSGVYIADIGGMDKSSQYTAKFIGQFEQFGSQGVSKTVLQARAMFQTGSPLDPLVGAVADYDETLPAPPSSPATWTADVWGIGLWDVALWDAVSTVSNQAAWTSIGVTGNAIAPTLQLTYGTAPTPKVELVSIDFQMRLGAVVT